VVIDKEEQIPLLSEVFAELGEKLLFNVELKLDTRSWSTGVATTAAREIEKHQLQGRSVVTSFDLRKLSATRKRTPDQAIGFCFDDGMLSVFGPVQGVLGQVKTNLLLRRILRSHCSSLTYRDRSGRRRAHLSNSERSRCNACTRASGWLLHTISRLSTTGKPISPAASDPVEVARLVGLNVDWIETDDPERLQNLLG
jgi:glycerophosphoryl diester phosphodiesterase